MRSAGASAPTDAFAGPDAGFDYFNTAGHYRHLAIGVVDALSRGSPVLVTGDPAPDLAMLAEALRTAMAPRQVLEIPCGPDLDRKELFGGASMGQESTPNEGAEGLARSAGSGSPVVVFGDADRLSDLQIKDFLEAAQSAPPELRGPDAAVLLARPAFLDRFETPLLHILKDEFAAHLSAQHLDRDEVEAFIRHQLPEDEQEGLFTAQRVALIAVTSTGDPAIVNRLAGRILEIEPGASTRGRRTKRSRPPEPLDKKPRAEPRASGEAQEIVKPQARRPRLGAAFGLLGIALGATALWLIIVASGPQQPNALVKLVRDRISPPGNNRAASAEVPARAAPPLPPAIAQTSPSAIAPTAAPPATTGNLERAADQTVPAPAPRVSAPSASLPQSPAPEPPASSPPAPPQPAGPRLSAAETAALVARGDAFLGAGDVTSARAFFERAADAGDSQAAMRMAVTFDPAFLDRVGLHGMRGDLEKASFWYRRARDLGGESNPGAETDSPPIR